ncbi:MAG: hypothetical protein D3906_16980, partial [Candidatus Electrothrix sp. AUS1_2]|nr:hypothetical protein [Candidatus Electrothrix sp. AUS1_2]
MADFIFFNSYLILLCPLLSFVLISLGHLRSDNRFVAKFAITLSAISCGYALLTALTYFISVMGNGHPYPEKMALDGAWQKRRMFRRKAGLPPALNKITCADSFISKPFDQQEALPVFGR